MTILKDDISKYTLTDIKVEVSKLLDGPTRLEVLKYILTCKLNPLHILDSYRVYCVHIMHKYKVEDDELDMVLDIIKSYDSKADCTEYVATSNGDLVNLIKDVKLILNNEDVSVYVQNKSEVLSRKEQFEFIKPFVLLTELRDKLSGNPTNGYVLNYKAIIAEINK